MNRRHRAAQLAGRASVQLHTLIFFAGGEDGGDGGGAKEEDAYILDLETSSNAEPSFTVMVPRYGIEGRVRLTKLGKHECLVRDPERHRLGIKDDKTGEMLASVTVFDKVRVKIWVRSSRDRRELVLDLLEPKILVDPTLAKIGNIMDKKSGINKKKQKTKK
jgi:exosome complex exonuclease DIS3/RRP44